MSFRSRGSDAFNTEPADLVMYTVANSGAGGGDDDDSNIFVNDEIVDSSATQPTISTDVALRVKNLKREKTYRNVFAIGDAAKVENFDEQSTAQTAISQAETAAYNVLASIERKKLVKFRYVNLGEMLTLGGDSATISSFGDAVKVEGQLASLLRRAIYSVRQPTVGQRLRSGKLAVESKKSASKKTIF